MQVEHMHHLVHIKAHPMKEKARLNKETVTTFFRRIERKMFPVHQIKEKHFQPS